MERNNNSLLIIAAITIMSVATIAINIYTTPSFPLPYVNYLAEPSKKTIAVSQNENELRGFTNEEIKEFEESAESELEKNKFDIEDYKKLKNDTVEDVIPDFPIDINKANSKELQAIPKIGPITAESILVYRELCGGKIEKISDLSCIKGIGEKTVAILEEYLYVE